jgi:ABC transport system ATP-binding/permease protein
MGIATVGAAYAGSPERALTYQVSLSALQVTLSGALFDLGWVLGLPSLVLPERLGVAALANYADIDRHRDPVWYHNGVLFWLTLAGALVLFCAATGVAVSAMERRWRRGTDEG